MWSLIRASHSSGSRASKLLASFVEPKLASFWSLTLPVAPQGRVHAGAAEDGLLTVEIDELAERERVSHEVGGGVLKPLLPPCEGMLSPTCAEKPGCRQPSSFWTSTGEMA
jgi:hypothetical protein